jgi:hypothetical protein
MGATSEADSTALQTLLPSTGFLLAYALPLLVLSVLMTFAGAFLTLDRTRIFAPRADAGYEAAAGAPDVLARKRSHWRIPLQGGLGGITAGYLFGRTHLRCQSRLVRPADNML